MRRGGLTRLVQQLGIALVILDLAHVPLPAPESHASARRARPDESCAGCDQPFRWHWAALDPEEADDDEALDLAAVQVARSDSGCRGHSRVDGAVVAVTRARPRHQYVRGHSKGLHKSFAGRSTSPGRADAGAAGFHPPADDRSKAPRAAMLQRWRC